MQMENYKITILVIGYIALLGFTRCFEDDMEYNYDYVGQIWTGTPSVKYQLGGTGLKCQLKVQSLQNKTLVVKMSDVEVGSFNGPSDCEIQLLLNISYNKIDPKWKRIEAPFHIYFNYKKGIMSIPEDEEQWITNVRKSIAQHLLIYPLKFNSVSDQFSTRTFLVDEESIFGKCASLYLFEEDNIDVEEESFAAWKVLRTVDFDKCSESVILQKSTVESKEFLGQDFEESVQLRSSLGEYTLVSTNGTTWLGGVSVTGNTITNLFGIGDNKFRTRTKQNFLLTSRQKIKTHLRLNSSQQYVQNLAYEVTSPFCPPSTDQVKWIKYEGKEDTTTPYIMESLVMGKEISRQTSETANTNFHTLLDEVAQILASSPSKPLSWIDEHTIRSQVLDKIHRMSELLSLIPSKDTEAIFTREFGRINKIVHTTLTLKQDILIEVASGSESSSALREVLRLIERGRIGEGKVASIFMFLTNHLSSPFLLSDLQAHMKHLSLIKNPFMTSASLLNFGTAVRRLCLQDHSLPQEIFGKFRCDEFALRRYAAYIIEQFFSSEKSWMKVIYLEIAIRIGPPLNIKLLENLLQEDSEDVFVKLTAIKGLRRNKSHIPEENKRKFSEILNYIIDDDQQDVRLRQAAIRTLISWSPNSGWWIKLATKTRSENSALSAFVYFTIKGMAEVSSPSIRDQVERAKFALPFCRKFNTNYRYPFLYFNDVSLPFAEANVEESLQWIPGIFEEISTFIASKVYGKFQEIFHFRFSDFHSRDFPQARFKLNQKIADKYFGEVLLTVLETIEDILPINSFTVKESIGEDGNKLLRELHEKGKKINAIKYFKAFSREIFFPTEIGLPLINKASSHMLIVAEGHLKILYPDMSDITFEKLWNSLLVDIPFVSDLRINNKITSEASVLTPWNDAIISAAIDNTKIFNLPLQGNFMKTIDTEGEQNLSVSVKPLFDSEFPMLYSHNIPFTSIKGLFPEAAESDSFKVMSFNDNQTPLYSDSFKSAGNYGVFGELRWKADTTFPFNKGLIMDYVTYPQNLLLLLMVPSQNFFQTYVLINEDDVPQNLLTFALRVAEINLCSQSKQQESKKVNDRSSISVKTREFFNRGRYHIASTVYDISFEWFSTGDSFYYHSFNEVSLSLDKRSTVSIKENMFGLVHVSEKSSDAKGTVVQHSQCLLVNIESLRIDSLEALKKFLKSDIVRNIQIQYFFGNQSCLALPDKYELTGIVRVSENRKKLLLGDLNKTCLIDPLDPTSNLETDAVFDRGILKGFQFKTLSNYERQVFDIFADVLRIIFTPTIENNYLDVHNREAPLITFTRGITSKSWDVELNLKDQNTRIYNLRVPRFVDQIVYPGGFHLTPDPCSPLTSKGQDITAEVFAKRGDNESKMKCSIEAHQFITFDNKHHFYDLTNCYVVLSESSDTKSVTSTETSEIKAPEARWRILVNLKSPGERDIVEIRMEIDESFIDIVMDKIKINGRKVKFIEDFIRILNSSGEVVCTIYKKKNDSFESKLFNGLKLFTSKKKIYIEVPKNFTDKLKGLCGNPGSPTVYVGPEDCIYTNATVLGYSWTLPQGHWCNLDQYWEHYLKVYYFQHNCKKDINVTYT